MRLEPTQLGPSAALATLLLVSSYLAHILGEAYVHNAPKVAVNIDFRAPIENLTSLHSRHFHEVNFAGNEFGCGDVIPSLEEVLLDHALFGTQFSVKNELPSLASSGVFGQVPNASFWMPRRHHWTPEYQSLAYLIASKMAYLMEQCYLFSMAADHWLYDICIGRSLGQFYQSKQLSVLQGLYSSLGHHDLEQDEVYANGTVVQHYVGGTDGRRASLRLECRSNGPPTIANLTRVGAKEYNILFKAPSFCDWRRTPAGHKQPAARLLAPMEGWCSNFTAGGWWTYEYCHPHSLVQFHKSADMATSENPDGVSSKELFLLGTLISSGTTSTFKGASRPSNDRIDTVLPKTLSPISAPPANPAFPSLMSRHTAMSKPSDPLYWPFINVDLIPSPVSHIAGRPSLFSRTYEAPRLNALNEPIKALSLELHNGSPCKAAPLDKRRRSARIIFFCPPNFIEKPVNEIVAVKESLICEYEVHIATPYVCAHPEILPQRPPSLKSLACYAMDKRHTTAASQDSSLEWEEKVNYAHQRSDDSVRDEGAFVVNDIPLEAIPFNFEWDVDDGAGSAQSGTDAAYRPRGVFSLGQYIRVRVGPLSETTNPGRSLNKPRYRLGQVLRHQHLKIRGVVIGWDMQCQAPASWKVALEVVYPKSVLDSPFYLLLVDELTAYTKGLNRSVTMIYSPESSLTLEAPLFEQPPSLMNAHISSYFQTYETSKQRYVTRASIEDAERHSQVAAHMYHVLLSRYPEEVAADRPAS